MTGKRISLILLMLFLLLKSIILLPNFDASSDQFTVPTKFEMENELNIVGPGTEIWISDGSSINRSFYYPIPDGASAISTNISISNINEIGNNYEPPGRIWLNIGERKNEYFFDNSKSLNLGQWGLQNRTITGEDSVTFELSESDPHKISFVLPKNASVTKAVLNISGHQRSKEWMEDIYVGENSKGSLGTDMVKMGEQLVMVSDPTYKNGTGEVVVLSNFPLVKAGSIAGPQENSYFGYSMAALNYGSMSIGNVVVGAPGYNGSQGMVTIVGGMGPHPKDILGNVIYGNGTGDQFGKSIATGVVRTDGNITIVVGAPNVGSGNGRAYVYSYDQKGGGKSKIEFVCTLQSNASVMRFGKSISIGDLNGDCFDDIAVSSDRFVNIYLGDSDFDNRSDAVFFPAPPSADAFIQEVGFIGPPSSSEDMALTVGIPENNGGSVFIYNGGSKIDTTCDTVIIPPGSQKNFGSRIEITDDIDGDGIPEFGISAIGSGSSKGWVGIYSGANYQNIIKEFNGSQIGDGFGYSFLLGPDLLNDGYDDLVIGCPGYVNSSGDGVGAVEVRERFPIDGIVENTPFMTMSSGEVWRSEDPHFSIGDTETISDLTEYFNIEISSSDVFYQTQFDEFVSIDIFTSCLNVNDTAGSDIFTINDITISYQYNKTINDITEDVNYYISNHDPSSEDGMIHVPITLGADQDCGLRFLDFNIEVDLIPDLHDLPDDLTVYEDTHNLHVIDLYEMFSDDLTPLEEIEFYVDRIGENFSKFEPGIFEGRYVSIDLSNGSYNDNWTGIIEIKISAVDSRGGWRITDQIQIQVLSVNDPPGISNGPANSVVVQDNEWTFDPRAVDDEGDKIYYSISGPANMSLDENGIIHWTPNAWQVGENDFSMTLSDGVEQSVFDFSIEVINSDDAPIFLTVPEPFYSVPFGNKMILQFLAYDLDPGDQVSYIMIEGPNGGMIDSITGLFQWTPLVFSSEVHNCTIQAIDLTGLTSEIHFKVGISIIDDPPEVLSIWEFQLYDMILWEYQMEIIDPNDDYYNLDLINSPPGMILNKVTDLLEWTPDNDQVGTFEISVLITSTSFKVYHNFTLNVSRSVREWEISLQGLEEFQELKGVVKVQGTVSVTPSTVEAVLVKIGAGEWIKAVIFQGIWSIEFDSKQYADGETEIQYIAFDGVEYSESGSITIICDNDEEKSSPWLLLLLLIPIVGVIISVVLLNMYVKKKKKEREEEMERIKQEEEIERSKHDLDTFLDFASSFQLDEQSPGVSVEEDP